MGDLLSKAAHQWQDYTHARQTKLFFSVPCTAASKAALSLNRCDLSRLVSAITGHGPFGYHQHLIDPQVNQWCRYCGDAQETFVHFFNECPVFMNTRLSIRGARECADTSGWAVDQIVQVY